MKPRCKLPLLILATALTLNIVAPVGYAAVDDSRSQTAALVLDTSGSMGGRNLRSLQEAAKLLVAMLDWDVVVVNFDDAATSKAFRLQTGEERRTAMAYVDTLRAGGSTNYLAGLAKVRSLSAGAPIIFVSDGANTSGTDRDVLTFVDKEIRGRLITIGVETPQGVDHLLARMAAATGGQHVRVDKAEDLVKTLLDCTVGLANYRSHRPGQNVLQCRQVRGKALVFAYDATPATKASPGLPDPPFEYGASLPGEYVAVQRVDLDRPTDLHISIRDPKGKRARLAHVLRSDLARATLRVDGVENAVTGGSVQVSTEFRDPSGRVVDPRTRGDLGATYRITDAAGTTLASAEGKLSADKPRLEATLPLPDAPGEHAIVQETTDKSTGAAFTAEEKRTVMVEKAVALVAEPGRLSAVAAVGERFGATLRIRPAEAGVSPPSEFAAAFSRPSDAIALIAAKTQADTLRLSFEAKKPGVHQGVLMVRAVPPGRFAPLRVPYAFRVKVPLHGLAIPEKSHEDLGSILPGVGLTKLGPIEIPSRDDLAVAYAVEAGDFSNGSEFIPLEVSAGTVTPTSSRPAELEIMAQVGDVSPGDYRGHVDLILQSDRSRRWRIDLSLLVSRPLTAEAVDFGKIAPGQIRKQRLVIHNAAGAVSDLSVAVDPFDAGDEQLAVTMPDRVSLSADQKTALDVSLAVSPLTASRGRQESIIRLRRAGREMLQVPVAVTLVDPGEASGILISPDELRLAGPAGSVIEFTFRVKPAHDAALPDQVTAAAAPFEDGSGSPVEVTTALEFPNGNRLVRTNPTTVKGYLVTPARAGVYRGRFAVSTQQNGKSSVPVTLEVPKE